MNLHIHDLGRWAGWSECFPLSGRDSPAHLQHIWDPHQVKWTPGKLSHRYTRQRRAKLVGSCSHEIHFTNLHVSIHPPQRCGALCSSTALERKLENLVIKKHSEPEETDSCLHTGLIYCPDMKEWRTTMERHNNALTWGVASITFPQSEIFFRLSRQQEASWDSSERLA